MAEADFPPAVIAEAVAAARAWLRLESSGEETLLAATVVTALRLAEAFAGQRLIARAFEDRVTADGAWHRLAAEPVTAMTASADAADIDSDGIGWVRVSGGGIVSVGYVAGLAGSWSAVPPPLAQGVTMLAAHLFEHRERDSAPPAAIAALWRPWRRVRVGSARR